MTETSTEKKTRPGWATLAGMACVLALVGLVMWALYFFTEAPGSMYVFGGVFLGAAVISALSAAIAFFMSRRV